MNPIIIKHLRTLGKQTQAQVARDLGVERSAVAKWETGVNPLLPLHEFAFRHLFGDELYWMAQSRVKNQVAPTTRAFNTRGS